MIKKFVISIILYLIRVIKKIQQLFKIKAIKLYVKIFYN